MKITSTKIITTLILMFYAFICTSQDYLVTKDKDTIYGKIEWKSNVFVYVKNKVGKQKFRADKVDFFQRGAFRFVSVKTNFPEFLLEVKKGEVSYYLESHLKSRFTIDYQKKVFLKYKDELYPITVKKNLKDKDKKFLSNNLNTIAPKYKDELYPITVRNNLKDNGKGFLGNNLNTMATVKAAVGDADIPINIFNSGEPLIAYSTNFKWSFHQILEEDNALYKLIKKNNFTFEDIELLVDLANTFFENQAEFEKRIDTTLRKGYAQGYVIPKKKDTILGSIKMNGRFILSDKINFIHNSGKETNYNPKELNEFKINNRIYKNVLIKKKEKQLIELISGEISMYRDLKEGQSYLTKDLKEFFPVDKKEKYLELFKNKPEVYKRIIENEYQYFEIKSIVTLYNNAPQQSK